VFAAFVQGPIIRLVPVGLVLLAIQRSLFAELRVAGVVVQLVLAFVVTCGAVGGSERGAIAGVTLGAMFDLVEGLSLGTAATAFTIAGIVAGLLALITPEPTWWMVAITAGFAAALGELGIPAVRAFVGVTDPWDERLFTIVPVVAVAALVLAPLLAPLARWSLRIKPREWKAPPPAEEP